MLHLVFDSSTERCKIFRSDGTVIREMEMHDHAVNGPGFGRWGRCPRGDYRLGSPVEMDEPAYGYHFTPVLGTPGRAGIGIHGGGSGLQDPFDKAQGWVPTHGCLRVQNEDNDALVALVREYERVGDECWIRVSGP